MAQVSLRDRCRAQNVDLERLPPLIRSSIDETLGLRQESGMVDKNIRRLCQRFEKAHHRIMRSNVEDMIRDFIARND
jgi:hypothetical protein